jgi:hypothetical protein
MYNSTKSNVPTRKIERRCRRGVLRKHVRASVIQGVGCRRCPGSGGCVNNSGILIIQGDVSLCVDSEKKDIGQEGQDEQAQMEDHG